TAKWGLQIAEMIFQTRSRKPAIPPRCALRSAFGLSL
ncbi:DUF6783 domain-containing protein, partial [Blautia sp.]